MAHASSPAALEAIAADSENSSVEVSFLFWLSPSPVGHLRVLMQDVHDRGVRRRMIPDVQM